MKDGSSSVDEIKEGTGFDMNLIEHNSSGLLLNINSDESGPLMFEVIDISGKRIYSATFHVDIGNNQIQIKITDITEGTYIFKLQDNRQAFVRKIYVPR